MDFFFNESSNIGGTEKLTFYKWKKIETECQGGAFGKGCVMLSQKGEGEVPD